MYKKLPYYTIFTNLLFNKALSDFSI